MLASPTLTYSMQLTSTCYRKFSRMYLGRHKNVGRGVEAGAHLPIACELEALRQHGDK